MTKNTRTESSYPNPWLYNGKPLEEEDTKGYFGFVYLITCPDGKKYVGRKYFGSYRKQKGKTRRSRSESNWKEYYGSNDYLKELVEELGPEKFKREILHLGRSKGEVNFKEVEEQFLRRVLYTEEYLNMDINGKYKKVHVIKYA